MLIRLLKPYQGNPSGSVVDWGRGVAELLVLRRIAEPIEEVKAVAGPPQNKAVAGPRAIKSRR